ncbi:MAG TPA: amidohydrolase family protein, partial [Verrucomicrobiae bacterium]|nr:amidohydrolase family protein [Verrucomicrobiae bacterium]
MKRWLHFCSVLIALLAGLSLTAFAAQYDLVIRGGKIVDGTGNPWFYGDVAVKGDRIAAVGAIKGGANRVIDATGLVIAPGFVDMHSHSDWVLLEDGNAQSKIRQGVTTEIIGESTSVAPATDKLKPRTVSVKGESVEIRRLRDYFTAVERAGISVNVASYVGEGTVWECVMGT